MKVTLGEIYRGYPVLHGFGMQKIPNRNVMFRIGRWLDKMKPLYERAEYERLDIVRQHGVEKENPETKEKYHDVPKTALKQFQADFDKFLAEEIEIEISQINLDEIPENQLPSGSEMAFMLFCFSEPEDWKLEPAPEKELAQSV